MAIKVEKSNWHSIGLALSSGDDEYRGCKLTIRLPHTALYIGLPEWLLPAKRSFLDLSDRVGTHGYDWLKPGKDGRYGYTEVFERRYGWTYTDKALHLYFGVQTNEWPGCKSKCYFIPWLEWRHVRTSLLNLDGSLYADVTRQKFGEGERLQDSQPRVSFDFADYDGEVITAVCRIEEREWRAGAGWFKWLSLFRKPMVRRSLDLSFSSEVGPKNGSWKGGTIGHSTEIAPGELPRTAFERYCEAHKLTIATEPAY